MSVHYQRGPFPFTSIQKSAVAPTILPLVQMGLSTIAKAYWLSKSYDYTYALGYTLTETDRVDTGSTSGTGTIIVSNNFAATTSDIPESRVNPVLRQRIPASPLASLTLTSSGEITFPHAPPEPYSFNRSSSLAWFGSLSGNGEGYATDGSDFFTCPVFLANIDGTNALTLTANPNLPGNPTTITAAKLNLIVDGITFLIPLFAQQSPTIYTSIVVTGSVTINFNNFWTP